MTDSAEPDQLASFDPDQLPTNLDLHWIYTGSTLFAKTGYIQVQQDKGYIYIS